MRLNLLILVIFVGLTACASKKVERDVFLDSDVRSAEEIYNNALQYLEEQDFTRSQAEFKRVEDQYPYSAWVRQATLMTAWSYYLTNKFDEAILYLNRYLELYPGTKEGAYAYYLRAMCYYERIGEVNRDPTFAIQAENHLRQLIGSYPNSVYARDGRFKLELVQAALAAHEMYLGRQGMTQNNYGEALNRFRAVVTRYNRTAFTPEALHRQVELYLTLGLDQEARRTAAILSFNYRGSVWYKYSYNLLKEITKANNGKTSKNVKRLSKKTQ